MNSDGLQFFSLEIKNSILPIFSAVVKNKISELETNLLPTE